MKVRIYPRISERGTLPIEVDADSLVEDLTIPSLQETLARRGPDDKRLLYINPECVMAVLIDGSGDE